MLFFLLLYKNNSADLWIVVTCVWMPFSCPIQWPLEQMTPFMKLGKFKYIKRITSCKCYLSSSIQSNTSIQALVLDWGKTLHDCITEAHVTEQISTTVSTDDLELVSFVPETDKYSSFSSGFVAMSNVIFDLLGSSIVPRKHFHKYWQQQFLSVMSNLSPFLNVKYFKLFYFQSIPKYTFSLCASLTIFANLFWIGGFVWLLILLNLHA